MSIISDFLGAFRKKEATNFTVSDFNSFTDYSNLVDSQNYLDQFESWTYKALKTKAEALINYDQELYKKTAKEEIEVEDDQLYKDLQRFNKFQTLDEARKLTVYHLGLTGNAFWVMFDSEDRNYKVDFYTLNPQRVKIKTDKFGLPAYYIYQDADGNEKPIEVDNIIHFRDPSPKNWLKGYSALQASRYAHNTNEFAHKYNMNFFGNSGRPEGFLVFEGASPDERLKLEKMLKEKYGGVENARRLGVLNKKVEYVEVSKTQKELDFANSINAMRDEILAIHGVPKALVGLNDSTFNNAEQAVQIFQQYTLQPLLKLECATLNQQLIPKYYKSSKTGLYFEYEDPVEADKGKLTDQAVKLYSAGIITLNEARDIIDEKDVEGGESYVTDQTMDAVEEIKKLVTKQTAFIKSIPSVEQVENQARNEKRQKALQRSLKKESEFRTVAVGYFDDQKNRAVKAVVSKKAVNLKLGLDLEEEIKIAMNWFKDQYRLDAEYFNNEANQLLNSNVKIRPELLEKIRDNVLYFSTEINKTTQKDLQKIIADAVQNNWSIDETKQRIKDLFEGYTKKTETESRVDTIARTETNWIKNATQRDNYSRNEYVKGFEWLAVMDNFVRDSHAEADGMVRPMGYKFPIWSDQLGGYEYLEYPGDRNASAGNTVNCRCELIPVVEQ